MGDRAFGSCELASEVFISAVGHAKMTPQGFSECPGKSPTSLHRTFERGRMIRAAQADHFERHELLFETGEVEEES